MKLKLLLLGLLILAARSRAVDIRVETTRDFTEYHIIRNDTLPITNGFVRLQIVGHELWVQSSEDGVSWITSITIPIARDVNPHEFFRLSVLCQ